MKLAIGTAVAVLLASGLAFAQEPEKEKDKPAQQEEHKKQEPEKHPQQEQQQTRERQDQEQHKQQDTARKQEGDAQKTQAAHQQEQQRDQQKNQAKHVEKEQVDNRDTAKQQHVAQERSQQDQHNNARSAQRDGGNGNARRIREEDFHSHFGRPHVFHVERRDDRRFNYGGYWFQYSDSWPSSWSYDDEVYIDQVDDGYYLIDPVHPGVRIIVYVVE
jgi:hypothetical protein